MSIHEQRHDLRIKRRCYATLCSTDENWDAHVLNVNEKGALIAILDDHHLAIATRISLNVEGKKEGGEDFTINGVIAHIKKHYIGIECDPLDDKDKCALQKLIEAKPH